MIRLHSERAIEQRAGSILNPVARLRYLREAMGGLPKQKRTARRSYANTLAALGILFLLFVLAGQALGHRQTPRPAPVAIKPAVGASPVSTPGALPKVWQVEATATHEMYSNGLRIETGSTVRNQPRAWKRLNLASNEIEQGGDAPAGIVYHSTESHIAPFEPSETARLREAGESVLEYVRRNRSYHYLIDRFGRVYRVVDEHDAAWHAGASIWGDAEYAWLNLNQSFLGVSLEAATAGEKADRDPITPAQIHALKSLTEMLRSRYSIAAGNCITHAQISINPSSRLLGNHTDWASGFPFAAIGLPDNYALPLISMTAFGFGYSPEYLSAGAAAWTGLAVSEKQVRRQAAAANTTVPLYRAYLNERYLNTIARPVRDKESIPNE